MSRTPWASIAVVRRIASSAIDAGAPAVLCDLDGYSNVAPFALSSATLVTDRRDHNDVNTVVAGMLEAIEAERAAVRAELGAIGALTGVQVSAGKLLNAEPGAQHFQFSCDLELHIPEGTRVRLEAPGILVAGEVVRHDRDLDVIECVFRDDVGDDRPEGKLQFGDRSATPG